MDSFLFDVRYAARTVFRRPAFSAAAILTLAIGIGVNAVAFSAVSALLFKPLRFDHVERLAWVMAASKDSLHGQTKWEEFRALRRAGSFEAVAAETRAPVSWQENGRTQHVWALLVTTNYFATLGARVDQGRIFGPADLGRTISAIVSHRFWRSQLGAGGLGDRTMTINGQVCTVVGIMPDGFQGPGGLYEPDVWLPLEHARELRLSAPIDRHESVLTVVSRLRPDVPPAQARAELDAIARTTDTGSGAESVSRYVLALMQDGHPEVRSLAPVAWLGMALVGVVLLIACFNVASLLLARAAERQDEISMRAALGASRWRITRQLLTEGAVLSSVSGVAALALASWSARLLAAFSLPSPIPQRLHVGVDARLIGFTVLMVTIATVLPSLLPAWHISRGARSRNHRWRTTAGARTRGAFVIAQIAGSTIFLAAALLFVRSFWNVASTETGLDADHTLVAELSPFLYGYDPARTELFAAGALERLRALDGVLAVSVADRVPFYVGYARIEPYSASDDCSVARCPSATIYRVGAGHFAALDIPLREGRGLTANDAEAQAVISAHLARQLWPEGGAVGRLLRVGRRGEPVEIVGVTADVKLRSPSERPASVIYRPWRGQDADTGLSIVVRTRDDARAMMPAVREGLASLDRNLPAQSILTMRQRMAVPLWPSRTLAGFFAICGTLSVALATVGLFGVTYYLVQQRTREFGVRIALGATRERLLRSVLGEGTRVAMVGTLLGSAAAIASARVVSRVLVDVSPADPLTYLVTAGLQVAIALAACALPAWRASTADPMAALRAE